MIPRGVFRRQDGPKSTDAPSGSLRPTGDASKELPTTAARQQLVSRRWRSGPHAVALEQPASKKSVGRRLPLQVAPRTAVAFHSEEFGAGCGGFCDDVDDVTVLGAVVAAECEAIERACAGLEDEAFERLTNCAPWTLKDLIVHVRQTLQLPQRFVPGEGRPASGADWYRRTERETSEYRSRNVDRARIESQQFRTGSEVLAALVKAGAELAERFESVDGGFVIRNPTVGAITVDDYTTTRVISVAVHGLDVALSIGADFFITPEALDVTARVVEELAGECAETLGLTRLDLVLLATGRRDTGGRIPEHLRARLPLIS